MNETIATFLEWDTSFFGKRIARAEIHHLNQQLASELDIWCMEQKIDCLYFLANSDSQETISTLEQNSYQFVDIRITFECNVGQSSLQLSPQVQLRESHESDTKLLASIAKDAYHTSRFYADPCFDNVMASNLYRVWLKNSIKTDFAQMVVVAEIDNTPLGFVTCQINSVNRTGSIGLVGVAESARGKRLGQYMINYAINWFDTHNITSVQVVTQGRNIAAQRLYQRCGFITRDVQLWYHKWFTNCQS